jgi:hypothetical protein
MWDMGFVETLILEYSYAPCAAMRTIEFLTYCGTSIPNNIRTLYLPNIKYRDIIGSISLFQGLNFDSVYLDNNHNLLQ